MTYRETEAEAPASFGETVLFLAFFLGAIWAGYRLGTRLQAHDPRALDRGYKTHIGAEFTQAHLFPSVPSIQHWESEYASLSERARAFSSKSLDFDMVYAWYPPPIPELDTFDDFGLRPVYPLPGSVTRITKGSTCIDFSWTEIPVKGTRYTVEVAKNPNFVYYRSYGSETNSIRLRANRKADYYWRVRASLRRNSKISATSNFLVVEPELTEEEKQRRALASRVKDPNASLSDLQFCK